MTGRDSYKGVPQGAPVLWTGSGFKTSALDLGHDFMVVGSGVLSAGRATLSDDSIGFQTLVVLTTASGSGTSATSADIQYTVDPINKQVELWGTGASDTRRFSYMLINPGFASKKQ